MKKLLISISMGALISGCSGRKKPTPDSKQPPKKYTWEFLKIKPVPKWFNDAKFGIMIHWGPYSVLGHRKAELTIQTKDCMEDFFRKELLFETVKF
jgi:alpha-L-fucosidase